MHKLFFDNALAGEQGLIILQSVLGFTSGMLDIGAQLLAVFLVSLYWDLDQARFERLWLSLLPVEQRARARDGWRAVEAAVGAQVRSELVQSLLIGLLLGVGYWMIGLNYPITLAVSGALASLIPGLGAALALIPVLVLGLSNFGLAMLAAVYTVAVFALLQFVLEPRLFDRPKSSSLLVVLLVVALFELWGLAAVLAAPPLAAALQTIFAQFVQTSHRMVPEQILEQLEEVERGLNSVRTTLASSSEALPPQTINLVERLEQLVERANAAILLQEREGTLQLARNREARAGNLRLSEIDRP